MRLRRLPATIFAGLLLLIISGCTASAPRIDALSWELFRIYSAPAGTVREELSLFIHADDSDGASDLEELYLVHPESRLLWRLFSDDWEERTRGNITWIGSSKFTGLSGVPRGEYLVVLIDRAGERAEERLYIDLPAFDSAAFDDEYPKLLRQGGVFLIDSPGPGPVYLLGQDAGGRVRVFEEAGPGRFDPASYTGNIPEEEIEWYILLHDPRGWYAGSGPY